MEHAYQAKQPGLIDITLDLARDGRLSGSVRDHGCWRENVLVPDGAMAPRGRGLGLIRAVMDQVEVVTGSGGTTVTFTDAGLPHPLPGAEPTD